MITFALFDPLRSTLMSYHNFSDDKGGIEIAMGRGASLSYLRRSLKHFTFCGPLGGPKECYLWYQREGAGRELMMTTRIVDCVTGCDGWEDRMEVASRRFVPPR